MVTTRQTVNNDRELACHRITVTPATTPTSHTIIHCNLPIASTATRIYDTERVSIIYSSRSNIIYDRRYHLNRGDINCVCQRMDINEGIYVFPNIYNANPNITNSTTNIIHGTISPFERETMPIMILRTKHMI